MNKTIIGLLIAGAFGFSTIALVASEDRDETEHEESRAANYEGFIQRFFKDDDFEDRAWLADARAELYRAECGDCHTAYPPFMLPVVSWQSIMDTLDDHFGESAELDFDTRVQIQGFLGDHAAGRGKGEYAERMWRATRGMAAPVRITETDYFIGQHHEIPLTMVKDNPEVQSFSRCETCHTSAGKGSYDEDEVRIAGYGKWDD